MRKTLLVISAAVLAACSKDKKSDAALQQDLALAGQVQQQTPPSLTDTAIVPEPQPQPRAPDRAPQRAPQRLPETGNVRPRPQQTVQTPPPQPAPQVLATVPAPTPAVSNAPASREIGAGSALTAISSGRICTTTNRPGDKIVATVSQPVTGSNGAVIPAGSQVVLEVASVTPGDSPDNANITFRLRSVVVNDVSHSATGEATPQAPLERTKIQNASNDDKKKVIGGAVAGAVLGRVLGGSTKGAVVGAAAGAATGAVVAKAGEKYQACLNDGSQFRIVLNAPISM